MKGRFFILISILLVLFGFDSALAEGGDVSHWGPIGKALAIGVAALGGTLSQGKAISSALDSIGRNPSSKGDVFLPMLIGLAFVESLVVLAFVIANGIK